MESARTERKTSDVIEWLVWSDLYMIRSAKAELSLGHKKAYFCIYYRKQVSNFHSSR